MTLVIKSLAELLEGDQPKPLAVAHRRATPRWRTGAPPSASGIYVIYERYGISYVGSARDLAKRLVGHTHITESSRVKFRIIRQGENRAESERKLIERLRPPRNTAGIARRFIPPRTHRDYIEPATMICDLCGNTEAEYLDTTEDDEDSWYFVCAKCPQRGYCIELKRFLKPSQALDWAHHLLDKSWCSKRKIKRLLEAAKARGLWRQGEA